MLKVPPGVRVVVVAVAVALGDPDGDDVGEVVVGHEVQPVAEEGAVGLQGAGPAQTDALVTNPDSSHIQRHRRN